MLRTKAQDAFPAIDEYPHGMAELLVTSLGSVSVTLVVAHEGRLPAKSLQSDRFNSKLSKVEKLLRDESQLRFWLKLFDGKFVTTPLDELELA